MMANIQIIIGILAKKKIASLTPSLPYMAILMKGKDG